MNELKIEYIKVGDLTPYEKNARHHADADLETIIASIEKFGFDDPIGIWSEKNIIVEGHGRAIAAKRLGMKEVPCIRLDHLTDEERRAYALAHNKTAEMSEWDFDLLESELRELGGAGFNMDAFGFEIGDDDIEPEEDEFEPEVPQEPKTQLGDIYQLGPHRLICGDSTDPEVIQKVLGDYPADLLITDPPYNVAYEGKTKDRLTIQNDRFNSADAFREFLRKAFDAASSGMRAGAAFYIWYASSEGYNFIGAAQDIGWHIRQQLIWVKNVMVLGRQDYHWQHEPCLYGWKDGAGHYFIDDRTQTTVYENRPDIMNMKKQELQQMLTDILDGGGFSTVIREDKPAASELHPTMKPIKLIGRLVRNSSRAGETVLDIFGGSGSTMIACEQLGRVNRTVELDPRYCDVIVARWEKYTGKKAEKL